MAWLESDAAVQDLADRVLSSDVQRVERLRQLLWHHLKAVAFFAENHQWAYFNPAALDADAPVIRVPLNDADGSSRLTARPADLSSTTPAFGFPALYRWASLTDQDLAVAVSQSRWDATPTGRANPGNPTPADPRTRSHAQRLNATRASLAGPDLSLTTAPGDELTRRLARRAELGQRYLDTLVSVHQHFRRSGNRAAVPDADPSQTWSVRFPVDRPVRINDADGQEIDRDPGGAFGLWFAAIRGRPLPRRRPERGRRPLPHRPPPPHRHRPRRRHPRLHPRPAQRPLHRPGLGVVSLESTATLAGERIRTDRADELLKQWAAAADHRSPGLGMMK